MTFKTPSKIKDEKENSTEQTMKKLKWFNSNYSSEIQKANRNTAQHRYDRDQIGNGVKYRVILIVLLSIQTTADGPTFFLSSVTSG